MKVPFYYASMPTVSKYRSLGSGLELPTHKCPRLMYECNVSSTVYRTSSGKTGKPEMSTHHTCFKKGIVFGENNNKQMWFFWFHGVFVCALKQVTGGKSGIVSVSVPVKQAIAPLHLNNR